MALLKGVETFHGLELENAYHRVLEVRVTKKGSGFTARMVVGVYKDQEARDDGTSLVMRKSYNFDFDVENDNQNVFVQAYTYLKSLETYKGAVDI